MIPMSPGTSSPPTASGQGGQSPDGGPRPVDEPEKPSPRMIQPAHEAEEDGMDVDVEYEEESSVEERGPRLKRGRDDDDGGMEASSEPKLKRQRTDTSPSRTESAQNFASSSSSSSSSSTSGFLPASAFAESAPGALVIRQSLNDSEVSGFLGPEGIIDQKKAAAILFGEATRECPRGFSLLLIAGLSPELEQGLNDCDVRVLWKGSGAAEPRSLALVTPASDRKRLSTRLLEMQINAGAQNLQDADEVVGEEDDANNADSDGDESAEPRAGKLSTALMIAAALDDPDLLCDLLTSGADPNQKDPDGKTALMIAAGHGHIRIVRLLIHDRRTQANLTDTSGSDALSAAAAEGYREVVSLLLSFGGAVLPLQVSPQTDTHPLLLAASKGHHAICELIVSKGVDIDLEDRSGRTALWFAALNGQTECCRHLLDAGANVNKMMGAWESLLSRAVRDDNLELFNLLVERGAALADRRWPHPLLNIAVDHEHFDMIRRLLELKVDINATGVARQTALTVACMKNSMAAAKVLLEAGANPDIPDGSGWNSLVYAASAGNVELLELLIAHGARLSSNRNFGYLALYEATNTGKLDAMKLLLSRKVPTSAPRRGSPLTSTFVPLILLPINNSAYDGNTDLMQDALCVLATGGIPLNEVGIGGWDALILAVSVAPLLVNTLLQLGMTIGQIDSRGHNALELAAIGAEEVLSLATGPNSMNELAHTHAFMRIVETAKRQHNWYLLRDAAINKTRHPIVREILCQKHVDQPLLPADQMIFHPLDQDLSLAMEIMQSACMEFDEDWDRMATEIKLCLAGMTIPAINAYCAHIEAFPALKPRLFGPGAVTEIHERHWDAFMFGITATMEKLIVAGTAIEEAYDDLGWRPARNAFATAARGKIGAISSYSAQQEHAMLEAVFAGLFDECLQITLANQAAQMLYLHMLPLPSGGITGELMNKGVYAALAEGIENAWRLAWSEAIRPAPEASSSASSSSASSLADDMDSGDLFPIWQALAQDSSSLSEQQSAQLMQAFRKALAANVDSGEILTLPKASAEAAGLYADLMHRQLHMLAQFIKGETEIELELTPSSATAPTAASEPVGTSVFNLGSAYSGFDSDFDTWR